MSARSMDVLQRLIREKTCLIPMLPAGRMAEEAGIVRPRGRAAPPDAQEGRMVEISFRIEGELAILEFVPGGLDPESVQDRVEQLLPLLKHLLDADVAFDAEPEASLERRVSGIAAQGMKVDAAISATVQEVALLTEIITGRASIADHGFPEFDDD